MEDNRFNIFDQEFMDKAIGMDMYNPPSSKELKVFLEELKAQKKEVVNDEALLLHLAGQIGGVENLIEKRIKEEKEKEEVNSEETMELIVENCIYGTLSFLDFCRLGMALSRENLDILNQKITPLFNNADDLETQKRYAMYLGGIKAFIFKKDG